MISPRTVCFVYFALLFGTPHANPTNAAENTTSMTNDTSGTTPTSNNNRETSKLNTATTTFCTQATPKSEEGHFIFFLPTGKYNLQLIVAALTVGCLALLLTTLICACQVCHLRGIISSLQPRYDSTDRHARREKSESPCRDEGQVDRRPTETCFMLSEVTTAQEESRENQENKTEEKNDKEQPSTEPPVKDPNGDITQENSPEPDAKAPESSDTGV
ncbi:uncharacterized protein LOC107741138 [Sinocyclocheilus rhinocerous]|uniref:uncharacterized protein LOC107741138 n=1 Tax=Sinocyclocheilus rhinocerous TaxID=307959 RepID=UPI0007B96656|nr:PREDICTED: uncharacterized protein LOC107741138 [Sinocyclocheilus rhinocerous]